jgi:hypothetical protein
MSLYYNGKKVAIAEMPSIDMCKLLVADLLESVLKRCTALLGMAMENMEQKTLTHEHVDDWFFEHTGKMIQVIRDSHLAFSVSQVELLADIESIGGVLDFLAYVPIFNDLEDAKLQALLSIMNTASNLPVGALTRLGTKVGNAYTSWLLSFGFLDMKKKMIGKVRKATCDIEALEARASLLKRSDHINYVKSPHCKQIQSQCSGSGLDNRLCHCLGLDATVNVTFKSKYLLNMLSYILYVKVVLHFSYILHCCITALKGSVEH